jgi:cyclopropane fatty-acyl-phospholipid synthase-like methyltransferase
VTTPSWDDAYSSQAPAPWDIGRPQPAFARLAGQGLLSGRVLDAGCGTGEHVLLAAAHGAADAIGVDVSARAIARARAKAAERGIAARFEVGDALHLSLLTAPVDTIIDSGLFHVFSDSDRTAYVASLAAVLKPGGSAYLMCFSDKQPGDVGPRRVSEPELRAAFADGWTIDSITDESFTTNPRIGLPAAAHALLAVIRRA